MKKFYIIIVAIFFSCRNEKTSEVDYELEHRLMHKEMDKSSKKVREFDSLLVILYNRSINEPQKIISYADSLEKQAQNNTDPIVKPIKHHILSGLHYLKGEIFYKTGKYQNSINEILLTGYNSGDHAAALAANHIKLGQIDKAKSAIDSIHKGWYIYDFALGNYYESVGNKDSAMIVYNSIKRDKEIKHYAYYKLALERMEDITKNNNLRKEIYFPPGNPSFEVCDSDNENRSKIFKLMEKLPENQKWAGTSILESPQINDKGYYWVRVTTEENKEYNYYIYEKTFEIKFFNPKDKTLISLKEWRQKR